MASSEARAPYTASLQLSLSLCKQFEWLAKAAKVVRDLNDLNDCEVGWMGVVTRRGNTAAV